MVDIPRLRSLLARLEERQARLERYAALSSEEYVADPERVDASKYQLLTAIEDALSIANHLIATQGYRSPDNFADAFRSLAEAGVLNRDLSERLQGMARFRNLLVHVYAEVDDNRVHEFLKNDLADLRAFAKAVLDSFPID